MFIAVNYNSMYLEHEKQTFSHFSFEAYKSMFSSYKVELDAEPYYKFLYIMLTIVQVLVMVNLLISIVGDSRSSTISKEEIIEP